MNCGDRVELTSIPDDYLRFAIAAGERGTVEFTDSLGTVHVRWDNGQRCGIIAESASCLRKIGGHWAGANAGPDYHEPGA